MTDTTGVGGLVVDQVVRAYRDSRLTCIHLLFVGPRVSEMPGSTELASVCGESNVGVLATLVSHRQRVRAEFGRRSSVTRQRAQCDRKLEGSIGGGLRAGTAPSLVAPDHGPIVAGDARAIDEWPLTRPDAPVVRRRGKRVEPSVSGC